ncbi:NAD-dependent malic enzyme [subsurface metagenome]
MFVFPGIGLGTILCKAIKVTQNMIYASGQAVPTMIIDAEKEMGLIYPEITRIRAVSARVALHVIRAAQQDNVDRMHSLRDMNDEDLEEWIKEKMYDPHKAVEAIEDELDSLAKDLAHTRQLSRENTMKL